MDKFVENNKKKINPIALVVTLVIVLALVGWCVYNAIEAKSVTRIISFSNTLVLFVLIFLITALGYLLGGITIKGVNLGTAGVFLVAILFGFLCTLNFGDVALLGSFHIDMTTSNIALLTKSEWIVETMGGPIQNIGLMLFVGSVGLIAGPNFFKNLKKNFKTYIVLGAVIILSSTLVAVILTLVLDYSPEFWAGILSGALTSTPGFSAAQEAAGKGSEFYNQISLGHAIAYPFGVVGVVLFVQLMPKFLKSNMEYERSLLKIGTEEERKIPENLFKCEDFGLVPVAITIALGLLLGSIKIPLFGSSSFSLGTTGGVLIMGLILGHFGRIGKLSLAVPESTLKLLREFGLMLFLLGAGFEGGVNLVTEVGKSGGGIVAWGFIGGAIMTLVPMIVGFFIAKGWMKLPLLNTLGSITGGMTSTPALGTLINTAKTEDVAGAYASTYPIALVLVVLACQLMITLL